MSDATGRNRGETRREDPDPRRREERERVAADVAARLRSRGVSVTGREPSEELVALLDAVERFERAVEARGGDLMVDEGPGGKTREPDDPHFTILPRQPNESVADYVARLDERMRQLRTHRPHGS
jgi:sugar phosphate isomerase/epimerase